jgi:hypothetical protein
MDKKKCSNCGKMVEKYTYGSACDDCAAEVWDRGFESTSENAYEIGFGQRVDKIKFPCDQESRQAIKEILLTWDDLEWACEKCKTVHIKADAGMDAATIIETVCKGCSCGSRIVPTPPKKFYS